MGEIELRDYQRECVAAIDALDGGSHLVQMATGLGKTVTFSRIARPGRMLVISHRDELVYQPVKYFDCEVGIEKGPESSHGEEVVSTSVQTLARRLESTFRPGEFDIIVTDEAHHALAESYRRVYDYLEPRLHVGFTATPRRGDDRGLSPVFDDIVFTRDLRWGIANGYLCDIDCRRVRVDWSTSGVRTRDGDFTAQDLARAVNSDMTNRQVAQAYDELHIGQTLVFASSVEHAFALSELIEGSVVITGKTSLAERRALIDSFCRREIPCLINFGVFTEGTDIPLIETVLLARPTKNPALYTQMVGRGLRLYEDPETGYRKRCLRLIDCMGATDTLDICTAPTLLGLNERDFPEGSEGSIDGSLLELGNRVGKIDDSPAGWVLKTERVDALAKRDGLAWIVRYDGSRMLIGDGWSVDMTAPDALGAVEVTYKVNGASERRKYTLIGDAEVETRRFLLENADDERYVWDMRKVGEWRGDKATERQVRFLKSLLGREADGLDLDALTKRGAQTVISMALERYGRCPVCGAQMKPSMTGTTLQCSTNRWSRRRGTLQLADGCGFSIRCDLSGEKVDAVFLESLGETGEAAIGGARYVLEGTRVRKTSEGGDACLS